MTIRKHESWGEPGGLDATGVVAATDVEVARIVERARSEGIEVPMIGLIGGDLCATMSGPGSMERLRSDEARRFPIDLGVALVDGVEQVFVAHVVVRRRFWRGRVVAAMNAQYLGEWDLGPKSHPNDGLLDISDADLSWSDKWSARRRAPSGTHVPHPGIRVTRTAASSFNFDPPGRIWIDGVAHGAVRHLGLTVEADAFTVVV